MKHTPYSQKRKSFRYQRRMRSKRRAGTRTIVLLLTSLTVLMVGMTPHLVLISACFFCLLASGRKGDSTAPGKRTKPLQGGEGLLLKAERFLPRLRSEDAILRVTLDVTVEALSLSSGRICILPEDAPEHHLVSYKSENPAIVPLLQFRESPLFPLMESAQGTQMVPARTGPDLFDPEAEAVRSAMADLDVIALVPIRHQGGLTGVIGLGPKRSGEPFALDEILLLEHLAERVAGTLAEHAPSKKTLGLELPARNRNPRTAPPRGHTATGLRPVPA